MKSSIREVNKTLTAEINKWDKEYFESYGFNGSRTSAPRSAPSAGERVGVREKETMLQALERISNDDQEESRKLQAFHRENGGDPMSHPHAAEVDFEQLYWQTEFHDDVKGGVLPKYLVAEGRKFEMDYFKNMGSTPKCRELKPEERRL